MLSMLIIFTNTNTMDENTFSEDICLLTLGYVGSWVAESSPGNCRESEEDLEGKQPSHSPRNNSSHCVASMGDNQKHMALPSLNTVLK